MKAIFFLFKSSIKQIILTAVGSAIAAGLSVIAIKRLSELVSNVPDKSFTILLYVGGLIILSIVLSILTNYHSSKYYEYKISNLRKQFASGALHSDFQTIENKANRIIPLLLHETYHIGEFVKAIPEVLVAIFQILAIWIYMATISSQLTISVVIIFAIIVFAVSLILPKFHKHEKALSQTRYEFHQALIGLVSGLKDLSISSEHKLGYIRDTFSKPSDNQAKFSTRLNALHLSLMKCIEGFILISFCLFFIWFDISKEFGNDVLVQFLALLIFLIPSFVKISTFFKSLKNAENALEQMNALELELTSNYEESGFKQIDYSNYASNELIKLNNVEYTYESDSISPFHVGPFSFSVFENEVLLIKGGNGSGKTTLNKLIAGLYMPKNGKILFKNDSITRDNLSTYKNQFSAVFTDSYVFPNLNYLINSKSKKIAEKYIPILELEGKIKLGKDFKISNTNLSFGQMGRLNLLRVLMEDKDIYLFDEWAANQDPHFKKKFYLEIIPELKNSGKTIVMISHDDKYFSSADRIITLRNGEMEG